MSMVSFEPLYLMFSHVQYSIVIQGAITGGKMKLEGLLAAHDLCHDHHSRKYLQK